MMSLDFCVVSIPDGVSTEKALATSKERKGGLVEISEAVDQWLGTTDVQVNISVQLPQQVDRDRANAAFRFDPLRRDSRTAIPGSREPPWARISGAGRF